MGKMKQKLDEMERLEQEYRDVKNRVEILQKSLEEIVNEKCMKFNFKDLKRIDCNPNYCQKKRVTKFISKIK